MHPRVIKRMEITEEILRKEDIKIIEVNSSGNELLSRIFSLIYIGDFTSYYLALLYGIDPTPVERVTYLKNQLAKG
jgi:glucose/mannose-6-phosphate isomerase